MSLIPCKYIAFNFLMFSTYQIVPKHSLVILVFSSYIWIKIIYDQNSRVRIHLSGQAFTLYQLSCLISARQKKRGGGQILPDIKMKHKSGKWTFLSIFILPLCTTWKWVPNLSNFGALYFFNFTEPLWGPCILTK